MKGTWYYRPEYSDGTCHHRKVYEIDGREVTRAEFEAAFPPKPFGASLGLQPKGWPVVSLGMGCDPSQIAEREARNKKHGVNVHYTPDGNAVIPDAGERKKLMKLDGVFDRDAFC